MKDSGVCPYCQNKFEVEEYGYGLRCSFCRKKIDVLPEASHWVHTPWGIFGISGNLLGWICKVMWPRRRNEQV